MMTAAEALVRELEQRGVPFIATLNGHGLDPIYLALSKSQIRIIDVRNEQAASYMAEAAGRLSRNVGVCAVSGGVAHVNALSGVLNAQFDGAPMLLLTGTAPLSGLGWGAFQDFDPVPPTTPLCKYARLVTVPERIAQFVHEAFQTAINGRPGPVHLAIPMDIGAAVVDQGRLVVPPAKNTEASASGAAEPEQVRQAAAWLAEAERPVLVAGSGLYYAYGEAALRRFLDDLAVPTVMPIWDRGCVEEAHHAFLGMVGALTGGPRLLADADLVLLLGVDVDYRLDELVTRLDRSAPRIIRVHQDPLAFAQGLQADLDIHGSPATVLDQLREECQRRGWNRPEGWLAEARSRYETFRDRCRATAQRLARNGTTGYDVVETLHEVLPPDSVLLVDGGNIGQWFHHMLPGRCPGYWLSCGRSGVVGWGLPAALAAAALHPDRPVVLLSGDGAFTFTVAELECAARQNLRFVAVVADDQRWGITASSQQRRHGKPLYSLLGPTRLDRVAEGFGCVGLRAENRSELAPRLLEALRMDLPVVLHVPIVPGGPQD